MARNGSYGDHITLWANAELFNVNIVILSSLGQNANTVTSPSSGASFGTIYLGHLAEGEGEHYLCLKVTSREVRGNVEGTVENTAEV